MIGIMLLVSGADVPSGDAICKYGPVAAYSHLNHIRRYMPTCGGPPDLHVQLMRLDGRLASLRQKFISFGGTTEIKAVDEEEWITVSVCQQLKPTDVARYGDQLDIVDACFSSGVWKSQHAD